jgi:hypothetical protein
MVQETWLPNSADQGERCTLMGCSNRDGASFEGLGKTISTIEQPYRRRLRTQISGINQQLGRNTSTIVPVWEAVLQMRRMVLKNQLPGVAKQSSLFMDSLGHPQKPLRDMASYMYDLDVQASWCAALTNYRWFGALYGINPQGSRALGGKATQAAVLQKLAWDTLTREPLNGLMRTAA